MPDPRNGYFTFGPSFDISGFTEGLKNWWYGFTGQTEKTSAYRALMEREDTAYQRAAADMEAAGLSKYGNISQASSSSPDSSSDPVNKSIQLISALMDLRGQKAAIDKSDAETGYINAGTVARNNENMTFEEKFQADMSQKKAQTMLFTFQSDLAKQEGQVFAEKFAADLQLTTQKTLQAMAQTGYLQQLTLQSGAQTDYIRQMKETEVFNTGIKAKDYSNYDFRFEMEKLEHNKKVDQITEQILKSTCERLNLGYDYVNSRYSAATKYIEMEILSYNYQYSVNQGLRTTDQASKLLGVNTGQFSTLVSNQLKGALDSLMNFGGILGLPSMNDLGIDPFMVNH